MESNRLPIGFFDSGVGGLSVYSLFKEILPYESTIYYGDLKNLPYGNKTKEELISFARNILNFFREQNVKAVVIACNTSSALAYDFIKDEYDFKIFPIIQCSSEVISKLNVNRIGVFATAGTVQSGAYNKELLKHNENLKIKEIACPNWVNFVESGKIESKEALLDISMKMNEMLEFLPEKIILGCTHYPYLKSVLTKFANKSVFIDPAEIFVKYIASDLQKAGLLNGTNFYEEKFYVSAKPEDFIKNSRIFYDVKSCDIIG